MTIRVITPPAVEPVTAFQALAWCRASSRESDLIESLIRSARARAEHLTQRVFVSRTLEWTGAGFTRPLLEQFRHMWTWPWASNDVELASPLQDVIAVTYLDSAAVEQTLDATRYTVDSFSEPAVLTFLTDTVALPEVATHRNDAVRIRFTAGYPPVVSGSDIDYRANLPPELISWMQQFIATHYAQRESFIAGAGLTEAPRTHADGLLDGLILASRFT